MGVPLILPYLLNIDKNKSGIISNQPLIDYLEEHPSGEVMSEQIKKHERYGLGKAIGNKACHLFAKWYIDSFNIVRNKNTSWGSLSYELPLDSNAGRVLFRMGWINQITTIDELLEQNVIDEKKGKNGKHYIRVTNIRGMSIPYDKFVEDYRKANEEIITKHLMTGKRQPRSIQLQQIPNILLLNTEYGIGNLDDGLIHIGTNFCFNTDDPRCAKCPVNNLCDGYNKNNSLITDYST